MGQACSSQGGGFCRNKYYVTNDVGLIKRAKKKRERTIKSQMNILPKGIMEKSQSQQEIHKITQ